MEKHYDCSHRLSSQDVQGDIAPCCQNPSACLYWSNRVALHMQNYLHEAEDQFTAFVLFPHHRFITHDALASALRLYGLCWKSFVDLLCGGYLLEWYDRGRGLAPFDAISPAISLPSRPLVFKRITLARGKHTWPRTILDIDAATEYDIRIQRYILVLRCDLRNGAPLRVTCTYDDPPVHMSSAWPMQVIDIAQPACPQWTADYTRQLCRCPSVPTHGHAQ